MRRRSAGPERRAPFDGTELVHPLFTSSVKLAGAEPVLFLSDLHFGDGSASDLFAGQDQQLIAFLERQRRHVAAIVFVGDIIDLPQAWTIRRVGRAHRELFDYLAGLVREHEVVFVHGNHDWAVDYETVFSGSRCREAVVVGDRVLAWHGHQLDLAMSPGAADATFKTYVHSLAERLTGERLLPPLERHDSRANWIAMSLAVRWSRVLLRRAHRLRTRDRLEEALAVERRVRYLARTVWGDPADVFGATSRFLLGKPFETVICGHTHLPGVVRGEAGTYANTGTWTGGQRTYAVWTGAQVEVREVDTERVLGDDNYAGIPVTTTPDDLFAWWAQQHRPVTRAGAT